MTDDVLNEGNRLKAEINLYNTVVTGLGTGTLANKVNFLTAFISTGNTEIPAGDETTYVDALRTALVALALQQLNAHLTEKQSAYNELSTSAT